MKLLQPNLVMAALAATWAARGCHGFVTRQIPASSRFLNTKVFASVAEETEAGSATGRISRGDLSLEVRTIADNPELVISHLKARRASEETIQAVKTIADLQGKRVALIQERDNYLNQRKEASALVGKLMQQKDEDNASAVDEAKEKSSQAAAGAEKAEAELSEMKKFTSGAISMLFQRNLGGQTTLLLFGTTM